LLLERKEANEPDPNADPVMRALDQLSLQNRSVLLLHYLDGHPLAEVADQLHISREAARSAMARARRAFRAAYGGGHDNG
jgi:RNA polymerase sigma factor (sigma-70 family)